MDHDAAMEQHDVLDNPQTIHLFPDLSKVKTEVIYPEDEGNRRHRPNICFEEDPDYNEESNNLNDSNVVNAGTGVYDDIKTVLPQIQMFDDPLSRFRQVQDDKIELHTEGNSTQVSEKASRLVYDNVAFSSKNIVRTYTKKPAGDTFMCSKKIVIGGNDRKVCKEDYVAEVKPNKIKLGSRVVDPISLVSVKKKEFKCDAPKVENTVNHAFQCQICNEILSNEIVAEFHIKYVHPNENRTAIETFISKGDGNNINDVAKVKANVSGKTEDKISAGAAITNINTTSIKLLNKKLNLEFRYPKLVIKNPPIPISVLFKCGLCDLHFINAQTGRIHSHRCNEHSVIVKETCNKCTRYFKPCDMVMHELQHLVTKSFKVYTIQFDLISRILCRCRNCNQCFAESHFWEHLKNPCINKFTSVYCNKCNLHINHKTYMKIAHRSCGNNIIIDYFDNVDGNEAKKSIDYSVIGDGEAVYKLWFCEICLRCSQEYLYSHQCSVMYNYACGECGLYFGQNAAQQHIEMHDEEPLKVQNFLLYSMQKNKFVQPVLPSYNCCKRCGVNYLYPHKHCGKNFEICNICNKKFEQEHYEAHKQYHDYDLDKLIHKTIDKGGYVGCRTRRYMYQCVLCDCFVSNYDYAVQHAQDHIKNKAMTNIYCKKCHRLYESSYFRTHEHVVITATVLRFDCKKLLDESWFDMFKGLDQVEIANVLTDSIYKDTRSLDLTCLQKDDSDMTLYVCSSCNVVHEKAVLQNRVSYKEYCWENRKYKCSVCKLYSPGNIEAHKKLHLSSPGVGNVIMTKAHITPTRPTTLNKNVGADEISDRSDELSDFDNTEVLKSTKLNDLRFAPVVSLNRLDVNCPISNEGNVNVNQFRSQKRTRMTTDHLYNDDKDYEPIYKMIREDYSAKQTPVGSRTAETKICLQNIYKCIDCDLCFVSFYNLRSHVIKKKHVVVKLGIKRCRHCKLKLPDISYTRHVDICALKNKGSINIIDIKGKIIEVIKSFDMIDSGSTSDKVDELTADCMDITKICDANDRGPSMDSESTIDKVDESTAHCAAKSHTIDANDQGSKPDLRFTVDKADESTAHCAANHTIDANDQESKPNLRFTVDKADESTAHCATNSHIIDANDQESKPDLRFTVDKADESTAHCAANSHTIDANDQESKPDLRFTVDKTDESTAHCIDTAIDRVSIKSESTVDKVDEQTADGTSDVTNKVTADEVDANEMKTKLYSCSPFDGYFIKSEYC